MSFYVPSAFRGLYSDLEPILDFGREYLETRLKAELQALRPVVIQGRVKDVGSAYAKVQKGDYSTLLEIDDLVACRIVFLHPAHVKDAVKTVSTVFPQVEEKNTQVGKPTDFVYNQPHLVVRFPEDYVDRNPQLEPISAEIQFTTYVQHALQESVHDIIYKGQGFSWREHRLDARLRGLLEIVDDVLENVSNVANIGDEPSYDLFDKRNDIIRTCLDIWPKADFSRDMRRFAM